MRRRGHRKIKIAVWEFWKPKHVKVPVYLKLYGDTKPEGYVAVVNSVELEGERTWSGRNATLQEFTGEDLHAMQQEVENYLHGFCDIKWEDFLIVQSEVSKPWSMKEGLPGSEVSVSVSEVQIGKDSTGEVFNRHSKADTPRPGRPEAKWDEDDKKTRTLIPDTPEARAALALFVTEMDKLGVRIKQFLSPKQIKATLARAGALLLPAPDRKKPNA